MIYLIRSYGLRGKSYLKVGFTGNTKKRFDQYFYHNPGCEVVSTREGDETLENLFHLYLKSLGFQYKKQGRLDEWFIDTPEIYQIFHISRKDLERKVWGNREKIFDPSKVFISGSPDYIIFGNLWRKNNRPVKKKVDRVFWGSYMRSNPDLFDDFLDPFTPLRP